MSAKITKFINKVYIVNLIDFASLGSMVIWNVQNSICPLKAVNTYKENLIYFPMYKSNFCTAILMINNLWVFLILS